MNRWFKDLRVAAALAALLCAGAWAAPAEPKDSAQAKAKLATVRARIAELTSHIGAELAARDALSAHLRAAELVITAKRRQLEALHVAQLEAQRQRTELRNEQIRKEAALRAERAALGAQVRAAYLIGRQEQLKLLLNQSNPAGLGRTLAYYGYFAQQRTAAIADIRDRLGQLQQLGEQIDQQSAKLSSLEAQANDEMSALQRARADRSNALTALTTQVASGSQELANLKREEKAVESLVAELARVLEDFPVDASQNFDSLRGKLPWPVVGRMTAHYQEARDNASGGVRWNGVLIETARGSKVRAPFYGRVVYADWLQGLGLLLIIGHGGGYMTLYGHAEVLYKSVGDRVAPGDVIAALSDTGGAPQLYFEIRQGRKTVDPKVWLKANP